MPTWADGRNRDKCDAAIVLPTSGFLSRRREGAHMLWEWAAAYVH